jgi:hypothetical protein
MFNACVARYEYLIVPPKSSTFCCTLTSTGRASDIYSNDKVGVLFEGVRSFAAQAALPQVACVRASPLHSDFI